MARSKRTVGALAALLAAGLLLGGLAALRLSRPARYPAKARGRLVTQGQAGFAHTAAARYLFTVGGQGFTIEGEVSDPERLIDVWYDPDDPADCSFLPERASTPAWVAAGLAAACFVGGGAVLVTSRDA
jgi:hypothetical protein